MNNRELKKLSVLITCIQDGLSPSYGSGNLVMIAGDYYVLTAAHCVFRKDTKTPYSIESIKLSQEKPEDLEDVQVEEILYRPELGDLAALKVRLGERERARINNVQSHLHFMDGDCGYKVSISGFLKKGTTWNVYELRYSGERVNEALTKYQYLGPELNNQSDPISFWKGMSGSGLYFEFDSEFYMTAILISTDTDISQNNEFWFIPSPKFKELIPELELTSVEIIKDKQLLLQAENKPLFSTIQESLLSDKDFQSNGFIPSPKLNDIKFTIRDDDNDTVLIAALSGLGKTRLLYEAFKYGYPLENCFFARFCGDSIELLKEADYLMGKKKNEIGMLIVDDCDLDTLERLIDLRNHTNPQFRIIATNHDYFEAKRRNINLTCYLEADDIREDIDRFIDEQLEPNDNNKAIVDEIKNMSDGYPQMAVDLVRAYKEGINPEMGIVDGLMRKLLKFDGDKKEPLIMQTLSLCQPMPYDGNQREAFEFMLRNDHFTPLFTQASYEEREHIAESLIKRLSPTLIQTQSNWLMVRPFPLAVYFTRLWFESCHPRQFTALLSDIQQQPEHIQNAVSHGFCKHIEHMHGNKSAYVLVENLVSRPVGSPFLNEEVLCSGLGSRFFLAFSHVNPSAIARGIWQLIGNKTIEWVRTNLVDLARRNIVFTLERLCFASESFQNAFKSLCKLSVAENEDSIRNNASGQIQQLFHIYLAGTEVSLSERLNMVQWLRDSGSDYLPLTLKCIDSAFLSRGFNRVGGSERFGLERKQDYMPQTYAEIFDYWDAVRDILLDIIKTYPDALSDACTIVENHACSWLHDQHFGLFYTLTDVILPLRQDKWTTLYDQLSRNRGLILPSLPVPEKDKLEACMAKMRSEHFIVSLNDARHTYWAESYRLTDEEQIVKAKSIFVPLVDQFLAQKIYADEAEFTLLLDDKDYIDFVFVATLVERMSPEQISYMFHTMLDILQKKGTDYCPNFMLTLTRVFRTTQGSREFVANVEKLGYKTLYIKLLAGNDLEDLEGYHKLKNQFKDPLVFLEVYLMSYQSLKGDLYCRLLEQVHLDYPECANELLNFILLRRFFSSEQVQTKILPIVKQLIIDYHVDTQHGNDMYEYVGFTSDVLESAHDLEFAKKVCTKFIDLYNTIGLNLNHDKVFSTLLKIYPDEVWNLIVESLISEEYTIFYFQVRSVLGSGYGFGAGPLFKVPDSEIRVKTLCRKYPDRAPAYLSEMVPCYSYIQEGDKMKITGFSTYFVWLLQNFGSNEHVRNGLHANLGSFSWTGSTIPYYERNISCFKQLLDDPTLSADVKQWAETCIEQYEKEKSAELEQETFMKFHYGRN